MEQHRTRTPENREQPEAPAAPGGASLAQQARGYADVARQARENCRTRHSAETEVNQRQNRPAE